MSPIITRSFSSSGSSSQNTETDVVDSDTIDTITNNTTEQNSVQNDQNSLPQNTIHPTIVTQVTYTIDALPPFHHDEHWLELSRVIIDASGSPSELNKFLALYKSLPEHIQRDYKNILLSDSGDTKYIELLKELKKRLATPKHAAFDRLYSKEDIGDRSPTQFLRDLKRKFEGTSISLDHLQHAFAVGLPIEYRTVVFSSDSSSLTEVAYRVEQLFNANKSMNNKNNSISAYEVKAKNVQKERSTEVTDELRLENQRMRSALQEAVENIKSLTSKVDELTRNKSFKPRNVNKQMSNNIATTQHQNSNNFQPQNNYQQQNNQNAHYIPPHARQNDNSQTKFMSNSNNCPPIPDNIPLCFYHKRFGVHAVKCEPESMCKWTTFTIPQHQCTGYCIWYKYRKSVQGN